MLCKDIHNGYIILKTRLCDSIAYLGNTAHTEYFTGVFVHREEHCGCFRTARLVLFHRSI